MPRRQGVHTQSTALENVLRSLTSTDHLFGSQDIGQLVSLIKRTVECTVLKDQSIRQSCPALCGCSLALALYQLITLDGQPGPQDGTFLKLRKDYPDFINAMFTFVCAVDSEKKAREIYDWLSLPCTCDRRRMNDRVVRTLHSLPFRRMARNRTMNMVLLVLSRIAQLGSRIVHRSRERTVKHAGDEALERTGHYLLDNPLAVLHACRCWYSITEEARIAEFLLRWLQSYRSAFEQTLPSLEANEILRMVLGTYKRLALALKDGEMQFDDPDLRSDMSIYTGYLCDAFADPIVKLIPGDLDRLALEAASIFLKALDSPEQKDDDWSRIQGSVRSIVARALENMMMAIPSNEWPDILPIMLGATIYSTGFHPDQTYCSTWIRLRTHFHEIGCAAPGCDKAPESHRFSRCARCKVVSYCSRECQSRAWLMTGCPHKDVCKDWAMLAKVWPMKADSLNGFPKEPKHVDPLLRSLAEPLGFGSEARITAVYEGFLALEQKRTEQILQTRPSGS